MATGPIRGATACRRGREERRTHGGVACHPVFLSARPPTDVSKVPTFIWVFNMFSKTVLHANARGLRRNNREHRKFTALPVPSRTCAHTTKRPMVEPWPCALLDCFWQAVVASPSEATPRLEFGLDGCGYDLTQEGTHIVLHETASHASHGHGQRRHLSRLIPTAAEAAQRETWHVRTTVRVLPHGQHIIRFTPMEAPSGTRMFVLVNRFRSLSTSHGYQQLHMVPLVRQDKRCGRSHSPNRRI